MFLMPSNIGSAIARPSRNANSSAGPNWGKGRKRIGTDRRVTAQRRRGDGRHYNGGPHKTVREIALRLFRIQIRIRVGRVVHLELPVDAPERATLGCEREQRVEAMSEIVTLGLEPLQ